MSYLHCRTLTPNLTATLYCTETVSIAQTPNPSQDSRFCQRLLHPFLGRISVPGSRSESLSDNVHKAITEAPDLSHDRCTFVCISMRFTKTAEIYISLLW